MARGRRSSYRKHDLWRDICRQVGIERPPKDWFAPGSTITGDAMEAVLVRLAMRSGELPKSFTPSHRESLRWRRHAWELAQTDIHPTSGEPVHPAILIDRLHEAWCASLSSEELQRHGRIGEQPPAERYAKLFPGRRRPGEMCNLRYLHELAKRTHAMQCPGWSIASRGLLRAALLNLQGFWMEVWRMELVDWADLPRSWPTVAQEFSPSAEHPEYGAWETDYLREAQGISPRFRGAAYLPPAH